MKIFTIPENTCDKVRLLQINQLFFVCLRNFSPKKFQNKSLLIPQINADKTSFEVASESFIGTWAMGVNRFIGKLSHVSHPHKYF